VKNLVARQLACVGFSFGVAVGAPLVACSSERRASDAETAPKLSDGAFYLGAETFDVLGDVPICLPLTRGLVVYVRTDNALYYCDGSKYRALAPPTGKPGKDGMSWIVVTKPAGPACPYGGAVIVIGSDANNDGVIDAITSTQAICNGAPGAKGDKGDQGFAGVNGRDGSNGAAGHDGANGANGNSVAIRMRAFASSATCPTGGVRVETGIDANRSGTLEDNEVSSAAEICSAAMPIMDAGVEASPPPSGFPPPVPGQVVVTEIMIDPTTVQDTDGEWFELFNLDPSHTYDLNGCTVATSAGATTIGGSVVIPPRSYVTLARSAHPGFTPTYVYGVGVNFPNSGGSLALKCEDVVIDAITYPGGLATARSWMAITTNWVANDDPSNWCSTDPQVATNGYGADVSSARDYGTPGLANGSCSATGQ
jgi:Lamin Tail Domain